ncbi:uncharacterized protein LOC6523712 isoform X17 [Drosophila yakuba]|uniref:Uncharacterized protein, isoform AA n=1 Tax=Drosophila yakuba TaxID=7245 RepID=A0A0R1EBM5_DROYA|nr:uncharacterized protein LOC6523712 isoform X17 [Drosophila yakuba]KRK04833.1 uncharacterized protein Dyak_GE14542, isoform AA [Drosophila yakuba]
MDSTLNIEEKEIETKNGSQKVNADVVKITSQDYDNFNEKQLESDIHSDFENSVTPRDNEDDNDLKIEESETEDFNSEDENTTDLGQNPSKPIEKPCLNNDSSDAERTLKMENPIIIDSSIKTNPSISVENLSTVSENNLKLDIVEGNTIGENSSNAEKASSEEDALNILYEGEEDKRTEVCLSQDNTKYSEEKNVNEKTTSASDLKTENSTADSVSLNESESTNVSKTVDLRKIFTPATDAAEILPNRKLYASSAFYSPTLHPTVEDQVELARRISHSLSDISNQTSKGQSMYVNRKKRSDKWVHEGRSQGNDAINPYKENSETNSTIELKKLEKIPLKLIMNPNGKVRDYNSLKELINVEAGLLSPDNCAELITALQLHQGRGAELFAKRRRKADNWVVDESHSGTQYHPSGIPDLQQYHQRPNLSPNILPAYSDAGKHRVQLNIHQNQLIERYSKPGLQVVQSPWKAALQTGSASSAFLEDTKDQCFLPPALSPIPYSQTCCKDSTDAIEPMSYGSPRYHTNAIASSSRSVIVPSNPQRDLAYTPCVAQGWGSRNVELPKDSFQCNESESPWQTQTHFGRADDSDHSFNNNIFGESMASNFAFDVQNRLHSLEKFQKYFLDYQRLEVEILRNREGAARELQPEAYESINDLTPQNEFNVLSGEELKTNYDLDEKVNVRELIESFEKQSTTKLRHVVAPIEGNEGLYVPKEISLSSYAAPPQQCGGHAKHGELSYDDSFSHTLPRTNFYANENSVGNIGIGEFPLSKPLTTGLNIGTPKQEPYSPPSYTKIVPGLEKVKFNQAPLPTENLARYEQPDRRSLTSGSPQYLNALQNSQIRNASPIPFGTSLNEQTSWRPKGLLKGTSLSPLPNQVQTFNKCARGWRSTPVKEQSYSSQYTSPLAGNLPYSDF